MGLVSDQTCYKEDSNIPIVYDIDSARPSLFVILDGKMWIDLNKSQGQTSSWQYDYAVRDRDDYDNNATRSDHQPTAKHDVPYLDGFRLLNNFWRDSRSYHSS